MIVVLAEKPSVARDLAAFLGANGKRDGYWEGNGFQVTWALGHLVTLKEPDEYDPALKRWTLEHLPFVPETFELKVIPEKRSRDQFAIVKRLFKAADELICATDAGREGELIFRYVLELAGCVGKPVRRLWLSSLTDAAIRAAWNNLRPATEFDDLYAAARCRSEADWIVGLNATRNFTVRHRDAGTLWSAGRVQTPVLAMIVRRDDDIRCFRPEPFWELLTKYRDVLFRYVGPGTTKASPDESRRDEQADAKADSPGAAKDDRFRPVAPIASRFAREEDGQVLLERVRGHEFQIVRPEKKEERSLPPLLYDLTELQRDMNRRYGLSAAATLAAAQKLYEAKRITYPRTDSRYLGTDQKKEVPKILAALRMIRANDIAPLNLSRLPWSGRIVNDAKVGDHHAIIPTEAVPAMLGGNEQKVYDAIVTRFIAVFYPPCLKEVTTVHGRVACPPEPAPFRARGVRILDPGWTVLYPRKVRRDDAREDAREEPRDGDDEPVLPLFEPGERGPHAPFLKAGETKAPAHYTENSLLGAMETAGQFVEEEELKEALKERGLGTPATRAAIIETLLARNYIERDKKSLLATDLGRYLIALIRAPSLKSAELTGHWEAQLKQIEAGRLDAAEFMREIVRYTQIIIRSSEPGLIDDQAWGECPRCGAPIVAGKRGFGCSAWRDGCSFVLWKTYGDREFAPEEIRQLLQRRALLEPRLSPSTSTPVILTLHASGSLLEIPVPSRGDQPRGDRLQTKSASSRRTGRGKFPRKKGTAGRWKPRRKKGSG